MFKRRLSSKFQPEDHCDFMTQRVRIQIRLPEGHWSGDVSRSLPSIVLRIEETMSLGKGRGTATLSANEDVEMALEVGTPNHGFCEVVDLQRSVGKTF